MQATLIEDSIKRSNRNLLLISVVVLIILIGLEVLAYRYFYNFFTGPHEITKSELLSIENADALEKYYVTVVADDAVDSGYQYGTEGSDGDLETIDNSYPVMFLDEKLLLVKTAGTLPEKVPTTYVGALTGISDEENREILDDIERDEPGIREFFLPYKLDATDFKTPGYIGIAAAVVTALGCVWGITSAMSRGTDMSKHPVMKRLGRYGDPQMISQQINMESSGGRQVGNLTLTRTWLMTGSGGALEAAKLSDIVWIYKKVIQQRSGKTYSAVIADKHGHTINITANEKVVGEMLDAVYQQVPWVLTGYDKQIETAWNSNRQALIDAVNQRRQQSAGQ